MTAITVLWLTIVVASLNPDQRSRERLTFWTMLLAAAFLITSWVQ